MTELLVNELIVGRLAAVDMHTAQHLVKHALTGDLAQDRTILLVTHHISLCLPYSSYLVELAAGKAVQEGTVQELRERGILQGVVDKEDIVEEPEQEKPKPVPVENEADLVNGKTNGKHERKGTNGKLVQAEARAEGRVSMHSYLTYIRASGVFCSLVTLWLLIQIRLINIGVQVFSIPPLWPLPRSFFFSSSIWQNGEKLTKKLELLTLSSAPYGGLGSVCLPRTRMLFPG